jgi:hypothetical protein
VIFEPFFAEISLLQVSSPRANSTLASREIAPFILGSSPRANSSRATRAFAPFLLESSPARTLSSPHANHVVVFWEVRLRERDLASREFWAGVSGKFACANHTSPRARIPLCDLLSVVLHRYDYFVDA